MEAPKILWLHPNITTPMKSYMGTLVESVEIPLALRTKFNCPKYVNFITEPAEFEEGTLYITGVEFANSSTGVHKGVPGGEFLPELSYANLATEKTVRIGGYMVDGLVFMVPHTIREWNNTTNGPADDVGFASLPNYIKFIDTLMQDPNWSIIENFKPTWERLKALNEKNVSHISPVTHDILECDIALG